MCAIDFRRVVGGRRVSGCGWEVGNRKYIYSQVSGYFGGNQHFKHYSEPKSEIRIQGSAVVILAVIKNLGYPLLLAHTFRRYATLRDAMQMWVNF